MYRHHRHSRHIGTGLLGAGVLAMLPFVAALWVFQALGLWTVPLLAVLAFLWWTVGFWHRREHLPGFTGADDGCRACRKYHEAKYARLKAREAERLRQAD